MKLFVSQINPVVGDIRGNCQRILSAIDEAKRQKADLVVFPELALTGYPPLDLLLMPHFIDAVEEASKTIAKATSGILALVGMPRRTHILGGKELYNSVLLYRDGQEVAHYDKRLLPDYDVFNERRYFEPGQKGLIFELNGKKIALLICEDIWKHSELVEESRYSVDPVEELVGQEIDLLVVPLASPYYLGKTELRQEIAKKAAKSVGSPLLICNQVGANDQLIFDGYSALIDRSGVVTDELPGFVECSRLIDLEHIKKGNLQKRDPAQELMKALTLGLRDYCQKLGFKKVVLGLSGGIDSAVVASIAVESLGAENVRGVLMPSRYTSKESTEDAKIIAKNLKIETVELPIEAMHKDFLEALEGPFKGLKPDVTEENIQSRIRGLLLMALSNKFGELVLNTGNKCELALGYCTLYGDMCGALSVIGDLTKGSVYDLAHWINRKEEIIPQAVIDKPPSAELRPGQRDTDTLPPYPIVDQVVVGYIEEHLSPEKIAAKTGIALETVQWLIRMIHRNEYKRRQAPPILKVTEKTFSAGRHYPIVEKWV